MNSPLPTVFFDHATHRRPETGLTIAGRLIMTLAGILLLSLMGLSFSVSSALAAEETCVSCNQQVSVIGDFAHRKDSARITIQNAGGNEALFREEILGTNFTVSITHLPAGNYTVVVGEVEMVVSQTGERLFDVASGSFLLASNLDIFANAGGARKVCYISGKVDHEDDSIRGPLAVSFTAHKGAAKFNTFEIRDVSGAPIIFFSASELADAFSAAATRVPSISEEPIWKDPSHSVKERASDLIRRMSLAEKVGQLKNAAPSIPRLSLPAYDYWNEALHGVAPTMASPRSFRSRLVLLPRGIRDYFTRRELL